MRPIDDQVKLLCYAIIQKATAVHVAFSKHIEQIHQFMASTDASELIEAGGGICHMQDGTLGHVLIHETSSIELGDTEPTRWFCWSESGWTYYGPLNDRYILMLSDIAQLYANTDYLIDHGDGYFIDPSNTLADGHIALSSIS